MATKTAPSKPAPTAPKEQIKPELLPVDLGGGRIEFVKRNDYAKRTAETFSLANKIDMKRDHVLQLLEGLDKGIEEVNPENPPEVVKLFGIVREDYTAGIAEVERLASVKQQEEDEKQRKIDEAKAREDKLFVAVKDTTADFASLAKNFDTGNMDRFIPRGDVKTEELLSALNSSFGMSEFTGWMQGDLVVELEKRGEVNVVTRLAEARGVPYSGLYNKAKTCKVFTPDKRKAGVSLTICSEIANAKFTDEQKKKELPALVEKALSGELTTQDARAAVRKIQGKPAPGASSLPPEEDPKKTFIVVDENVDPEHRVQIATGFPRNLFENGATVIDGKTGKKFTSFAKKGENRWAEIEAYAPPAPDEAAVGPKRKKGKK